MPQLLRAYCPLAVDGSDLLASLSPSPVIDVTARPLRIALLGYRSHPHVGGQGIYLYYLSKALVDAGHWVDVISGPPYPELDQRVTLIKLPSLDLYAVPDHVRALRWRHLRSFTDTYEWWTMLTGGFGEPYTFGRRLLKYFRQRGCPYDILHDNQSLCYALLTLQHMGLPLVATLHHPITRDRDLALAAAPDWGHRLLVRRWYNFLGMQAKVVQRLRHVVTVSEHSRRDIAAAFSRPAAQIDVIPNGVDTQVFRPLPALTRDSQLLITTASSDQPLKGLSILLRAMAEVSREHPNLRLLVIGTLKPEGATERELRELGLQSRVTFVTGLTSEEIVRHYAQATLAVVPSLYEGFGLPAAEAMACGIPLICSDGGALPEVVGDGACLVNAGDVGALSLAMHGLLSNPERRAALGQAGRERALQHLSWPVVAQRWIRFYQARVLKSEISADPLPDVARPLPEVD